jgi:hypothetical protein
MSTRSVNWSRREGMEPQIGVLHAPYENAMLERVAETMTSDIGVSLTSLAGGRALYAGRGRHACLETQGDLGFILDKE